MGLYMNGECKLCNATNVQGKNYNLHKLQGGGEHVPQCPIAGDATDSLATIPNIIGPITMAGTIAFIL